MKGTNLGEFEELILLSVGALHPEGYGVSVMNQIRSSTGRKPTLSAVHGSLNRLEEKGFLSSRFGGATAERGGKNKRIFTLTAFGTKALRLAREHRETFWKMIPKVALLDRS